MRLITTSVRYDKRDEKKAIELFNKINISTFTDDEGIEKCSYEDITVTDEEYFTYWEVLDTIKNLRIVKWNLTLYGLM